MRLNFDILMTGNNYTVFKKIVCAYAALVVVLPACAQTEEIDLFDLSIEELLDIKVQTGSLSAYSEKESASGLTIITRDKIEMSGAKNLAELLEQHVPGLLVMTHSEGDKIGMRGQIAAENYKLLLLVNGKNITNYVYEGVITEIDQWELGDIQRVEVISGPGSVTYGTGAMAGVINIITKTANDDLPTFSMGLDRNDTYQSTGVNVQYSETFGKLGVYSFLSYRETEGLENPNYYQQNPNEPTDVRYIGKGSTASASPQDYMADSFDRPQIKAHIGFNYGENFTTWLRYTQSGQTKSFSQKGYKEDENGNPGEAVNGSNLQTRSVVLSSEYKKKFTPKHALTSSLTLDSQEYMRYRLSNPQFDENSTNNIRDYAFSQNRITGTFLYDYTHSEAFDIIIGYEYSYIDVRAPWGKSSDDLWIREGTHIVSDADTSTYLQDLSLNSRPDVNNLEEVGSGMTFQTHTNLVEAKYAVTASQKLVYAHRMDFPDVSSPMFSPKFSWISLINPANTFVSTLQRAQRMMPLRAQYLSDKNGDNSKHETLDSLELSYTNTSLKNTIFNVRTYYNDLNAVGFTGEKLEFLTEMKTIGLELLASFKQNDTQFTVNHAYIEPLSVKMNEELKDGNSRNNVSFADYYLYTNNSVPVLLQDYGDGLNNIPKNITKFLFTQAFLNKKLKLHLNAQIYWDFEGSYDEMGMYQDAYDNFDTSNLSTTDKATFDQNKTQFERERALLEKEDAYKIDYNFNATVSYLWSIQQDYQLKVKFYAQNILNSSTRYYVSTGSNRFYPERLQYLENPAMYGLSLQFDYK